MAIPPGFARDSGKHLWLSYHKENDAWAIATDFGRHVGEGGEVDSVCPLSLFPSATCSLDVLAYVLGDVLNPSAAVYDERTWYISSGEGESSGCGMVVHAHPKSSAQATMSPIPVCK